MIITAINFVIAIIERRPWAARRILRDAQESHIWGQDLEVRLNQALHKLQAQADLELIRRVETQSMRTNAAEAVTRILEQAHATYPESFQLLMMEAFTQGQLAVESLLENEAANCESCLLTPSLSGLEEIFA